MRYLRQGSVVRSRAQPRDERSQPTLYAEYHQADNDLSRQKAKDECLRELFAHPPQEWLESCFRTSEPAVQR